MQDEILCSPCLCTCRRETADRRREQGEVHWDGLTRPPYASRTLESRCIRTLPTCVSWDSTERCARQAAWTPWPILSTQMGYLNLTMGSRAA